MHRLFSVSGITLALASALAGCETRGGGGSDTSISQRRIHFVDGYEAGLEAARRDGRPLLLFFTASWCSYCHEMEQDAFEQGPVIDLASQFVCVRIDADLEPDVCREFRVRGYPTVQFLSPRGLPLNRLTGRAPGDELLMEMQAALVSVAHHDVRGAEYR